MEQVKQEASGAMAREAANRSVEVPAVGRKHRYTEAYKLRILEETDACKRGDLEPHTTFILNSI